MVFEKSSGWLVVKFRIQAGQEKGVNAAVAFNVKEAQVFIFGATAKPQWCPGPDLYFTQPL